MKYVFTIIVLILAGCGDVTSNQGDIYFENGEFEKAVDEYTSMLTSDPGNTSYLYNRGRSYEELGSFRKAVQDFEQIIKADPKHVNAFLSLSKIAYEEKQYSKALLHAGAAVKQNESSAQAHFLSARAAHQLGYADQAMEFYNNTISIDRDFGDAYLYRGALKIGKNRGKSACEDFRRARSLNVEGADKAIKDYCS